MPLWDRIVREPALISGAVVAILNALVLLNVVDLTAEQVAAVNAAVVAVLAVIVRSKVAPVVDGVAPYVTPHEED